MYKFFNLLFVKQVWLKSFLLLFFSVATIIILYNNTVVQMVRLWTISDTYAHGFIVPFISLWLIWRLRHVWMALNPQPSAAALLLIFLFSIIWFLGNLVVVNAVTQLSFVMMVVLCIPAVLGWRISSKIAFPIAFLFFAVPIGDFMLPTMMDWTADFTVVALQLTGIPVYREGLQFVIPSGRWSVVEACSGIRYLLASVTVGSLFAYLNYQNFKKRFIFIVVSIIVPLIANWLRAYLIVLIGHYSGNELATGIDHLIYGWLFFGLIILLMLFIGMKWADSEPNSISEKQDISIKKITKNLDFTGINNFYKIYVYIFIIATFPHVADKLMSFNIRELPVNINEVAATNSWYSKNDISTKWEPSFVHPVDQYNKFFMNAEGQEVGLHISYYRQQNYERKLVTSANDLMNHKSDNWIKSARKTINLESVENLFPVESTTIRYKKSSESKRNTNIQAWKFYWVNEQFTSDNVHAKILGALSSVKGQGDDGAIIVIYTNFSELQANVKDANAANKILENFLIAHLQNIKYSLMRTKNN